MERKCRPCCLTSEAIANSQRSDDVLLARMAATVAPLDDNSQSWEEYCEIQQFFHGERHQG